MISLIKKQYERYLQDQYTKFMNDQSRSETPITTQKAYDLGTSMANSIREEFERNLSEFRKSDLLKR